MDRDGPEMAAKLEAYVNQRLATNPYGWITDRSDPRFVTEVSDPRPAVKIVSLLFAIVLIGAFGMAMFKPGEPQTDLRLPTLAPSADLPPIINDVNRYRHDGSQPTLEQATPSHKAEIAWN
jgi:hypothetical protein